MEIVKKHKEDQCKGQTRSLSRTKSEENNQVRARSHLHTHAALLVPDVVDEA